MRLGISEKLLGILKRRGGLSSRVRVRRKGWAETAQEGEFAFHEHCAYRNTPEFMRESRSLFEHFGFSEKSFEGKTIIDLGAGSRLRSKYFSGSYLIAIEPLADRFCSDIEWCDLKDAQELYSIPAENHLPQCTLRADLLISINVLDHCFDFERVISNVADYLKGDGLAFLSFDRHTDIDSMHPLVLTEAVCEYVFKRCHLQVERSSKGLCPVLGQPTYGHGEYALNYWLRKVVVGK